MPLMLVELLIVAGIIVLIWLIAFLPPLSNLVIAIILICILIGAWTVGYIWSAKKNTSRTLNWVFRIGMLILGGMMGAALGWR